MLDLRQHVDEAGHVVTAMGPRYLMPSFQKSVPATSRTLHAVLK